MIKKTDFAPVTKVTSQEERIIEKLDVLIALVSKKKGTKVEKVVAAKRGSRHIGYGVMDRIRNLGLGQELSMTEEMHRINLSGSKLRKRIKMMNYSEQAKGNHRVYEVVSHGRGHYVRRTV